MAPPARFVSCLETVSPPLPSWFPELLAEKSRGALIAALEERTGPVRVSGLAPSSRALALAALGRAAGRPLLVITPDDKSARVLIPELEALLGAEPAVPVLRLPPLDADPYRGLPAHPGVAAQRVAALERLAGGGPLLVVLGIEALLTLVPAAPVVRRWSRSITPGATVEIEAFARDLVGAGYRVIDVVTAPGDFARRGGLFDIWPPQEESPLRVELFGDQVESIRTFDAATQRTTGPCPGFRILPARESPIGPGQADRLLERLVGRARDVLLESPDTEEGLARLLEDRLAGLEAAPSLYWDEVVPLPDFVPCHFVAWEPEDAIEELHRRWQDFENASHEAGADRLPAPERLFYSPQRVEHMVGQARVVLAEFPLAGPGERGLIDLWARPPHSFAGRLDDLVPALREAGRQGRQVVLVSRAAGRRQRLREILAEAGLEYRPAEDDPWPPQAGEIVLAAGLLDGGVDFGGGPLLLTDAELFGPEPPPPPPRRRRTGEAFISDLRDLKEGDLVVHVDHGIGRYSGLGRREVTGEELLILDYAAGDRLYVPVSRLDLVQKYSGGEQAKVPLDRLGGPGWDRRRSRVRKAVADIAGELLDLYAARRAVRAHPFGPDTPWQREFEEAFPHELTADQAAALAEIRADLRGSQPMDRLLCGDVGYGKTEVALRAAFKVIQEGYQVAVLVPTTVLAFQHQTTFRARVAGWPVKVEMVSRFVSPPEVKKILAGAAAGEVDILIGTHRLLSRDVAFKRLGLLVIDEEQRFGVRHKESIKKLSLGVHTLAMSATPIPRTLQLSLAGVRDLSVIETPPRNRLAIQTHLTPWSASLAAAAIKNELRRGGQVFYITPQVSGIEEVAAQVRELVPEARVAFAHGQMPEGQLEKAMLRFVRGEIEVLVATTIIENGLDIPRANTILVGQAHRFGLSQLYQMRGRVGRSDQRAYAYLFVPHRRELTPEARRRLAAMVEFSELGAGFRIAALDLEIRGAGEFLGARQSGHIAAVGFEMYAEMLEKAVRRRRGDSLPQPPEPVTFNLGVEAFLPESYVPHSGQRLGIYKRLSAAAAPGEIQGLLEETEDRFGPLPEPARNMFRLAGLRLAAAERGAVAVEWSGDGVAVRFGERPQVDAERIVDLLQSDPDVRYSPTGMLRLKVPDPRVDRIAAASLALRRLVR